MKYELTKPCAHCPFRTDIRPFLRGERAEGIVDALVRGDFPCHKTTVYSEETEDLEATAESQHCAGALIMLEHAELPSQMMRICERLGFYDRTKLDMDAPVFTDPEEWIQAQFDCE